MYICRQRGHRVDLDEEALAHDEAHLLGEDVGLEVPERVLPADRLRGKNGCFCMRRGAFVSSEHRFMDAYITYVHIHIYIQHVYIYTNIITTYVPICMCIEDVGLEVSERIFPADRQRGKVRVLWVDPRRSPRSQENAQPPGSPLGT